MIDRAFDYMDHGYNVIPVLKQTKLPPIKWKEYQTQKATRDEWGQWAKDFPGCNLAVVCGETGGVVVVDADNEDAVKFCLLHMATTPFRVRTRKGVHFYYRHPGKPVKTRTKVHELPIDVRGDGGLATGLGSIHETGHLYSLDMGADLRSTHDLPVYNPDWFPEPIYIPIQPKTFIGGDNLERAEKYLRVIEGAGKGTRNFLAYKLSACMVKDFALSFDQALVLMEEWNKRCDPPLHQQELIQIIKSAVQTGRNQEGAKL